MTKPTKASEHAAHRTHNQVKVMGKYRLAEGSHSSVFPEHVGGSTWHGGPRNGHGGSHSVTSKGRK